MLVAECPFAHHAQMQAHALLTFSSPNYLVSWTCLGKMQFSVSLPHQLREETPDETEVARQVIFR